MKGRKQVSEQLSKDKIVEIIKSNSNNELLNGLKIGLAGSYSRDEQSKNSDIDIVIDGDSTRVQAGEFIQSLFEKETDILWLELLKEEDKELDKICIEACGEPNKESVYKTIIKDVRWIKQ